MKNQLSIYIPTNNRSEYLRKLPGFDLKKEMFEI